MTDHDVAIVGGGVVGCSIAKHLVEQADIDVAVIEKEHRLAVHQSGRNSGVLHPGFNYEPGSLKARFATEGTARMKSYCWEHDIPLREFGVLVVAITPEEHDRLYNLQAQATENGVDTELLTDREAVQEHEPHAAGNAALYAPEAASVDFQQYTYTLAKDAASKGADFYKGIPVQRLSLSEDYIRLGSSKGTLTADYLVNAAGLQADRLAHQLGVGEGYKIVPFRGEYYELTPDRRELVNTMIYPTPDPELPFLGVHFTRQANNKVIVGPNAVLAFGREAYRNTAFNLGDLSEALAYEGFWKLMSSPKMLKVAWDELNKSYRKEAFVSAAQRLVPDAEADDFVKSYAGNRAQLVAKTGDLVKDPLFEHGPCSTHILNAVSPGLTCSLPFGDHISNLVLERM